MKLNRFVAVKYSLEKVNLYTMKLSEKGSTGRIKILQNNKISDLTTN